MQLKLSSTQPHEFRLPILDIRTTLPCLQLARGVTVSHPFPRQPKQHMRVGSG